MDGSPYLPVAVPRACAGAAGGVLRYSPCMRVAVASEYRLQPEANKGLQAREAFFLEKGSWGGAEAPEPLPPEGGTLAGASSRNNGLLLGTLGALAVNNPGAARRSHRVAA